MLHELEEEAQILGCLATFFFFNSVLYSSCHRLTKSVLINNQGAVLQYPHDQFRSRSILIVILKKETYVYCIYIQLYIQFIKTPCTY